MYKVTYRRSIFAASSLQNEKITFFPHTGETCMKRKAIQPCLIRKCQLAILLNIFSLTSIHLSAQSSLIGRLHDSDRNKDCALAAIALLRPDSTLVQYTRSKKDGTFGFKNLPAGGYILLVSHPSYSTYSTAVDLKEGISADLRILTLFPNSDTLAPVIVRPRTLPPKMHGDTLEFNTGHIKTRINATVEELLVRLPGVWVDQNGVITVNGQKIERIMVDGEDLFGANPTIVTRNFNADMIAKVQVLDRKSDLSKFTGIDDGKTTKTLNLTLKEDSKRGYFLKAEVGGGPQGYYSVNGLIGSFKDHRQFAALGMLANTGNTGFSGGIEEMGSNLSIAGGSNDALGASAGAGIPRATGGGMHYANQWKGDESHAVGNYSYGSVATHPFSSFINRQTLPDSIYTQQEQSSSVNTGDQHALDAEYDYRPDSVSAFRFSLEGNSMKGHNDLNSTGSSMFNDTLVNNSLRAIHSDVQNLGLLGTIMYSRRTSRKKDRNFSIVVGVGKQDNDTQGYIYSQNNFYQHDGSLLRTDTTDQRKRFASQGLTANGTITYIEPMWKRTVFGVIYDLSFSGNQSSQEVYGREDGKYNAYIDSLSSRYQNNVLVQRGTVYMMARSHKFGYGIRAQLQRSGYKQTDLAKDSALNYHYVNFVPRANVSYNFDNSMVFKFNYTGSTQQPTITQLQAVQNNNDPLHITIGNPNLHACFSHSFSLGFNLVRSSIIGVGINFSLTSNTISTKTYTDTLGRQVSQAVNTNESNNAGVNFSFNRSITSLGLNIGVNSNFSQNRSFNYVNDRLNRNDNYNVGGSIALSKFVPDKFGINFNSSATYTYSHNSINLGVPISYWTHANNLNLTVFLLPGFEINTGAFYNWRQKLDNFDKKNSTLLWNAYILRNFFKNQLAVRWQINDILSQNAGISRSTTANQTTENNVNIIGRYWMISASWRFMHHRKAE